MTYLTSPEPSDIRVTLLTGCFLHYTLPPPPPPLHGLLVNGAAHTSTQKSQHTSEKQGWRVCCGNSLSLGFLGLGPKVNTPPAPSLPMWCCRFPHPLQLPMHGPRDAQHRHFSLPEAGPGSAVSLLHPRA